MKRRGTQFEGFDNVHPSMAEHPLAEHIEMVPIERLEAAGEHWVPKLWSHETGYMENLSSQIRAEGYRQPVQLKAGGRRESLWEGNHRLAVAQHLGHTHVPAVGVQGGDWNPETKDYDKPTYTKPSQL